MKMISASIGGLGSLALLVGIVAKLLNINAIVGITAGGYVRGATALFLLTLVVMVYDRLYGCCGSKPTEPTP
jgi:hypothetical protein